MSDEIGCLAEVISKEIDEGTTWFFLPTNSKVQEERNGLKMELLSKMEPELKYLEKTQLAKFLKIRVCSKENAKGVDKQQFDNDVNTNLICHLKRSQVLFLKTRKEVLPQGNSELRAATLTTGAQCEAWWRLEGEGDIERSQRVGLRF